MKTGYTLNILKEMLDGLVRRMKLVLLGEAKISYETGLLIGSFHNVTQGDTFIFNFSHTFKLNRFSYKLVYLILP